MIITYLIGNGFDLNLGLKTSYKDFLKYYKKIPTDNEIIQQFKKDLDKQIYNWSDLELSLGKYMEKFNKDQVDDIIVLLDDIQDNLSEYMKMQSDSIHFAPRDLTQFKFDICEIQEYLNDSDKNEIITYRQGFNDKVAINVILFNYTNTFEKLSASVPADIQHIHGTTSNNMLLGVNDDSQILNESIRNNQTLISSFVKPAMNGIIGKYRQSACQKYIDEAYIICIFGMSIGKTDKIWWEAIVNKMKRSNVYLIIFEKLEEFNPIREYRFTPKKEEIISKLLSFSTLTEQEIKDISQRIFVSFNDKVFKAYFKTISKANVSISETSKQPN